jgi:hypothetical protein
VSGLYREIPWRNYLGRFRVIDVRNLSRDSVPKLVRNLSRDSVSELFGRLRNRENFKKSRRRNTKLGVFFARFSTRFLADRDEKPVIVRFLSWCYCVFLSTEKCAISGLLTMAEYSRISSKLSPIKQQSNVQLLGCFVWRSGFVEPLRKKI